MQTNETALYEKCAHCHLFVAPNDDWVDDNELARYVHHHRGDEADEAIEETHEPEASGLIANLAMWQAFGPATMRFRFVPQGLDPTTAPEPDVIGEFLYWAKCVIAGKGADVGPDLLGLIDTLHEHVTGTSVLMNIDRAGTVENIDEIIDAARTVCDLKDLHVAGRSTDWLGAIDDLAATINAIGSGHRSWNSK
jgi:hypothetical protein